MMLQIAFFVLSLLSWAVVGAVLGHSPRARDAPSMCKITPGNEKWPSPEIWSAFNQSIGGRLIRPIPPGAVCHPEQTTYSALQCPAVQASWYTEVFHTEDPVSAYWDNWSRDTCLPDPRLSCSGAGYPVFVVNATSPEHVRAGIEFGESELLRQGFRLDYLRYTSQCLHGVAKQHNIRLIVKNSGHDFVGRSSAPNSLSIWVHHMKGIKVHENMFRPAGCSNVTIEGHAITAAAGTQMLETYRATGLLNRTVLGGNGRTVALGGFITGGGHSILAPHYGMAADQVLELELVTPSGEIVTANECQNTDLFWAMRGVSVSIFRTHPSYEVSMKLL